jgi:hypothetical protein
MAEYNINSRASGPGEWRKGINFELTVFGPVPDSLGTVWTPTLVFLCHFFTENSKPSINV